ncbi:uncharacterized protein LOC124255659 isoform X2 [Haliotis rubra]|uniref:uncharacterized protein LOC124255659 isoform X2 n=1 Tax=Haliotis rubra TaxID=36100 RepID=UPI001EE62C48|nr:uncharacterized protein LOC124255659 isoform X2 [Haliotis rubra]
MFLIEYLPWTVYKSYNDRGEMMVLEVTGLLPGETYIFRLQARNDYGDSDGNVLVEAGTAGDPPDQEKLEASCISTGVLAGATVGGILFTLLIGGIVLIVLYRKGYRVTNILKGAAQKSSSYPEPVEMDNRGYSSLVDAAADTSTYEGVTETPPVTYESIRASPYQNIGAHSRGPDE